MFERQIASQILNRLDDPKVIVLLGARQTGKTTLVQALLSDRQDVLQYNGDFAEHRKIFEESDLATLRTETSEARIVLIDEAQRIAGIGIATKLMMEQLHLKVILTGSTALQLNQGIQEPLTGRKWSYELFPFTWAELVTEIGLVEARSQRGELLIYGSYPAVVTDTDNRAEVLRELYASYLFQDILALSGIRKPQFLERLLQALAYQVSNEFSLQELSRTVGVDVKTIEQYIQLLEQSFIVFRLGTYKRNLRTELSSKQKIFFWDNGIRNAVIGDLRPWAIRQDKGALWENYLISERIKASKYARNGARHYFWRTVRQQEIDLIEQVDGKVSAFEIKLSESKKPKFSRAFTEAYPEANTQVIGPAEMEEFLGSL